MGKEINIIEKVFGKNKYNISFEHLVDVLTEERKKIINVLEKENQE